MEKGAVRVDSLECDKYHGSVREDAFANEGASIIDPAGARTPITAAASRHE